MSKWLTTNPPTPLPWGNDPKQSKSEFLQVLLEDGTETLGFFGLTDSDKRWVIKEHWFTIDSENPVHTVVGWHSIPKWIECSDRLPEFDTEVLVIDSLGDHFLATCYYLIDGTYDWRLESGVDIQVKAWMEIPEYEP